MSVLLVIVCIVLIVCAWTMMSGNRELKRSEEFWDFIGRIERRDDIDQEKKEEIIAGAFKLYNSRQDPEGGWGKR
jgi:hypothetical protein